MKSQVWLVCMLSVLCLGSGCGDQFATIDGTIMLGESPISGADVYLEPDGNSEDKFFGLTLDDGEIQIDTRDGIPPGQYDIVVVTYKMRDGSPLPLGEQGDAAKESGRAIKQVYVFKTELKSGVNKLELDIKQAEKRGRR